MNEIWKDIPNYEGIYQVSSMGEIRSCDRIDGRGHNIKGKILVQAPDKKGYKRISLFKDGIYHKLLVHRIVACSFLGENKNLDINHKDGNTSNNILSNLEWCTRSENLRHSYKVLGRSGVNKGRFNERNKSSKPISMYNLNGEYIRTFSCSREASRVLNIDQGSISKAANGIRNKAGGYKWKYGKFK